MAYIDWWNRTGPITMGERFGLNEISTARKTLSPTKSYTEDRIDMKPGGIVEPGVEYYAKETRHKKLIHPMPEGMDAWLKKEKIKIDWEEINRADRAKLKLRFSNRNNPSFKALEQKKIFEDYIEGLKKEGKVSTADKSVMDLIKDSKADIGRDVGQDVISEKNFFVKKSSMLKLYPKLEARAIELLNQGLTGPEVTSILEKEGTITVNKLWHKGQGEYVRDLRPFTKVYEKLLEEGKVKEITETIAGKQIPTAERIKITKAIFDYMEKNPDVDSTHHIAKAVSPEINRDITGEQVENVIKRSGQDPDKLFQTSSKKIFSDVKVLDGLIKKNQKLLASDISFKDKSRILIKRYAEAIGKPLEIAMDEFPNRLKKLGNLYAKQPQRYEKELYSTLKIPANYVGSSFQANFVALAEASGQLGVLEKAKLLALPQKEIKLLSELSTGVRELGGFSMAGDHTDISALMKNFANYRKNFTRIEWVRHSLNQFKKTYDNKIVTLYRAAKRGQTTVLIDGEQVPIKDRIKFWQTEFKNKTGYRIGDFKIDAKGNTYIEPTALRIPDIKNPVNTVLRQTLKGLETYKMPGEKPIEITNAFDKAMMRVRNVGERIEVLKKWQGKSELLNSRLIKALGAIPRLKNFVKLLTAGTITSAALTTLAQAEEIEPGDKTQEASVMGDVAKGTGAIALGTAIVHPKETGELAKKVLTKAGKILAKPIALTALPFWKAKQVIGETIKSVKEKKLPDYELTDPNTWMHAAFWNWAVKEWGLTKTLDQFSKANIPGKAKILSHVVARGGLNPNLVKFISSKVAWPATAAASVYDAYKDYQRRKPDIEKQKELIEQGVVKEEEFDKEEPMFAMGGIASLIK